jgi:hypothetical protein
MEKIPSIRFIAVVGKLNVVHKNHLVKVEPNLIN